MSGVPQTGGVADFSTFSPHGSWTGNEYLGDMTLFLSFGVTGRASGAVSAGVDLFVAAVPPYEFITPGGGTQIPEPLTGGLAAAGLSALLWLRRRPHVLQRCGEPAAPRGGPLEKTASGRRRWNGYLLVLFRF